MKPGASFYIWHADAEGYNFRGACRDNAWKVRQCLVWNKNSLVLGRSDYQWKHEPCLYGWKEGAGHAWYSDRKQTTVLDFDKPLRNGDHPTMKPVDLFGIRSAIPQRRATSFSTALPALARPSLLARTQVVRLGRWSSIHVTATSSSSDGRT